MFRHFPYLGENEFNKYRYFVFHQGTRLGNILKSDWKNKPDLLKKVHIEKSLVFPNVDSSQ